MPVLHVSNFFDDQQIPSLVLLCFSYIAGERLTMYIQAVSNISRGANLDGPLAIHSVSGSKSQDSTVGG